MNFKQARINANLSQLEVIPHLKKVDQRVDAPLLSKYENGVCMPTSEQFKVLCKVYGKEPQDILTPADVDYGVVTRKKDGHKSDTYRLCTRIPMPVIKDTDNFKAMLKQCGYTSITSWLCHCISNLERQYARKTKKDRSDAATSKAANTK